MRKFSISISFSGSSAVALLAIFFCFSLAVPKTEAILLPQLCEILGDCPAPGPCAIDVICHETGCLYLNAIDGSECVPDDWCRPSGVCVNGACVDQTVRDCSGLDTDCLFGVCDSELEECVEYPREYGTVCSGSSGPCIEGNICNGSGACEPDYTSFGTVCDDNVGACEYPGICTGASPWCEYQGFYPDGAPCDDELFCTIEERCFEGECQGGEIRDCSSESDTCNEGVCDEELGQCIASPLEEGTVCDTGFPHGLCLDAQLCNAEGVCVEFFKEEGVVCRQGDGTDCNPDEVCTGNHSYCPVDITDQSLCCRNRPIHCHLDDHDDHDHDDHDHSHHDDDDHDGHHGNRYWWVLVIGIILVCLLAALWFFNMREENEKSRPRRHRRQSHETTVLVEHSPQQSRGRGFDPNLD